MKTQKKWFSAIALLALAAMSLNSCVSGVRVEDMGQIRQFHKATSHKAGTSQLATGQDGKGGALVDLYIDYSDCMTTATKSAYYMGVQPAIIACSPNYYSIKGGAITFETNDKMRVHQLLNDIRNVDYSDLKGAVDSILNNRREAIIITDGEYYQKGIGANLNNPYLADEFKEWLQRGLDVYVYSEPYQSGKYVKNRYYMLFTDHRLDNNIQQIFSRNAPANPQVKMVHLYSGIPGVNIGKKGVTLNEQLLDTDEGQVYARQGWEWHKLDARWDDIYEYIKNATDDDGNPMKGGDFFLKGIRLNVGEEDAYRPEEIEVRAYEVSGAYTGYDPKAKAAPSVGKPLEDFLVVDTEAWKQGEVVLKLAEKFDGQCLNGEEGNLLRIDICVKQSKENLTGNPAIGGKFQFDSPYGLNTSVYESLKQTLLDPAISPERSGNPVVYTIYLSTYTR